jgi:outer membrane protein TolC
MRWKFWISGLAVLLAVSAGCKQRIFVTPEILNSYQNMVPQDLVTNPNIGALPVIPSVHAPANLRNLERSIRYLSLAETTAIALEQGTVGQPSLLFPGISLDNLVTFTGNGVAGSDSIRVLALSPAIVGPGIDAALSKFDTVLYGSMTWTATDQPIATPLQSFQAGASNVNAIVQEQGSFQSGLLKPLPTGGIAGITFNVPYTYTNLPARVNPVYQPLLQFQFEQPLLQGFGVEINQIRAAHPGSILNPGLFNNAPTPEGILITRLRFNQQRADFERNLNQMLLNTETAYWNLYGSYWTLYSRDQGLRFAHQAWNIIRVRFQSGRVGLADLAQAQGQYELFRAQRLQAIDQLLDNERQLRGMLGMQIEDGTRLVPSDPPNLAEYTPNWELALQEAMSYRPELFASRQDVKSRQLYVLNAKNLLLPDLRFTATYDANSNGQRLDGGSQTNALRNLASNTFNDWQLGLRLNVPIGFRAANAQLRQAQLQLAQSYLVLQDQELKTERFLGLEYRRIIDTYQQIKAQRAQRDAFALQVQLRYQGFRLGRQTLDQLLEAQRFWADALANEYQAIVAYNNALCAFEFAKGTIIRHNNISITEGPVPAGVQQRAVDHMQQRTKAIVLRERALPTGNLAKPEPPSGPINMIPQINASSLPAMWKQSPPLRDAKELPAIDPNYAGQAGPNTSSDVSAAPAPGGPVEANLDELYPGLPSLPAADKPAATTAPTTLPAPAASTSSPIAETVPPAATMPAEAGKHSILPLPADPVSEK